MAFLIVQTCGQIYNSREAALRYTIPSLQTSYKGLARELLSCSAYRNGCIAWDSGWGCLEKLSTYFQIQNTQVLLQAVYGASEALVGVAELTQSLW